MNKLLSRLGNKIRKLRKSQNLSQEGLAEKAGLHYTYIGAVERGERNLSLKSIKKIADSLGVNIRDLFPLDSQKKLSDQEELIKLKIINLLKNKDIKTLQLTLKILKDIIEWQKEKK